MKNFDTLSEKEINELSNEEFEKIVKSNWENYNNSIFNDEDHISYGEWYDAEARYHNRLSVLRYL